MAKKIYLFQLLKFYSQTKLFIFTFVFKTVTFFFYFFSSWKAKEYGNPILLDKKKKKKGKDYTYLYEIHVEKSCTKRIHSTTMGQGERVKAAPKLMCNNIT